MTNHVQHTDIALAHTAGKAAAEKWLATVPISMGQFRDEAVASFENYVADQPDTPARLGAWHKGFERGIAEAIAGGNRHGH